MAVGHLVHLPNGSGSWQGITLVTFRVDESEFKRFRLPDEKTAYTAVLKQPWRISFARFDLMRQNHPSFAAALTAKRPALQADSVGELAILLPNWRSWSVALLDWIVDHHFLKRQVERAMDRERSSELLAQLCRPT
jgi:hypothetical protein